MEKLAPLAPPDLAAQMAARALLAVLDHPDVATYTDERFFEGLLKHGLQYIPGLGDALFQCGSGVDFSHGWTQTQADIVGARDAQTVIECEVKYRSKVNWQERNDLSQLDAYADNAPSGARLFLLSTEVHHEWLRAHGYFDEVQSLDRWTRLWLPDVRAAVARAADHLLLSPSNGLVERLMLDVSRLPLMDPKS
jgi:hypothetical protein